VSGSFGFFADDLTGASDVLAQAHRFGLDAALVLDPSSPLPDGDVVGVAGTARSLSGDALDAAVRAGLAPFTSGFELVLYKVCSTFDSSPTVGSIGRGIELLAEAFPTAGPVPVVPAQPDFGRYTAFSHHFGRSGDGVHRLDRHPVMSRHPSTPMHEADLRLVLRDQLSGAPDLPAVHLPDEFGAAWSACRSSGAPAFVVDAVSEADMDRVAEALLAEPGALVVGSGGIMAALARSRGTAAPVEPSGAGPSGPVLVVSASASAVTAAQIGDAVEHGFHEVAIPADDTPWVDDAVAALREGRHVVAHTTRGPDDERYAAAGLDPAVVGTRLAEVVRAAADLTADVMVCGGDTSSHTLSALGVGELRVTDQFVPVGPICRTDDGSVLAGARLVLKGGQVGPVDMFRRFAAEAG
jgi:3-oxoisoapionate kinase